MTQRLRSVMDLRALPDVVFGPRDIMWWGTLGFGLIDHVHDDGRGVCPE